MTVSSKSNSKNMQDLWQDSYLGAGNEGYLENLYESYLTDPHSVPLEWQHYFAQLLQQLPRPAGDVSHAAVIEEFLALAKGPKTPALVTGMETYHDQQQEQIIALIAAYRKLGHLQANLDPLGLRKETARQELDPGHYGFTNKDLSKTFNVSSFQGLGRTKATLAELIQGLRKVYCLTIGFEYTYISSPHEMQWLEQRIEQGWANFQPSVEEKRRLLTLLVAADGFEKYLGFKYVGQKRFSLEGGDALIPLLNTIIHSSVQNGTKETIIGMAHRGRLNVLANIVGQDPKKIFAAFEGTGIPQTHSGDVKYHLGYSANVLTQHGVIHIALAFNPSHLEIVSPVAQGAVRARQRRRRDTEQQQVLPIQIHGDAAFAGQGVVMETFNMSQLRWFGVGGSIHIVVNNQVGFTISNPKDARSTTYCTDIAKMIEAPVLHVNANDPEAVYFAALFAIDFRNTFKKDVVIDLVCYRRQGHNEADEPSATQPLMYKVIKAMPVPYVIYADKLKAEGVIQADEEKKLVDAYRTAMDEGRGMVDVETPIDKTSPAYEFAVDWAPFIGKSWTEKSETAVPLEYIKTIASQLEKLPQGFAVQPQVKKMLEAQKKMADGTLPINWGYAETLAYASLLDQGYPIRLCGQDACRGTFAHRHAVLHDQNSDAIYIPLSHVSAKQAHINLVDSFLSEEAVLAFEYGYSAADPNFLVLWEAQFGDFANGAQVVIDQFISSGEQKWGRLCGLVMLLPHGYEGQGPEHSSARLERYLQLCSQENLQVCVPSTPAQIFHLLRRQMVRRCRKPLIVMTPKSLLRNPLATSHLDQLTAGEFQLAIPETDDDIELKKVNRLIITSGKIYYELLQHRRQEKINQIAMVRLEQLYPFPEERFKQLLAPYAHVKDVIWCQEEPQNQGAWSSIWPILQNFLNKGQTLRYVGRKSSASPAVGYHSVHEKEQEEIVTQALSTS